MRHTLVAAVVDKPGVLNRMVSLFRRRRYNIESLAVGHSETPGISRMTFVVEGDDRVIEQVKKQLEKLAKAINEDENFNVYSLEKADIIETDSGNYSTFIEVSFSARDFKSIIHFMFFYGPSSVEVIRPPEIKLKADDLQEGLMDLVEMVHKYTEYITKIMTREDIEKFTKQLFK